jgi:hypothetical protein
VTTENTELADCVKQILEDASLQCDGLHLDLWYPRLDDRVKYLVVGLMDVRAADEIRISYDFDRDGWKIEQASTFEWGADDPVCDPDWKEVAFIKAWTRENNKVSESAAERL